MADEELRSAHKLYRQEPYDAAKRRHYFSLIVRQGKTDLLSEEIDFLLGFEPRRILQEKAQTLEPFPKITINFEDGLREVDGLKIDHPLGPQDKVHILLPTGTIHQYKNPGRSNSLDSQTCREIDYAEYKTQYYIAKNKIEEELELRCWEQYAKTHKGCNPAAELAHWETFFKKIQEQSHPPSQTF